MKSPILIPLLAGLVLLGACKGKDETNEADSASTPVVLQKPKTAAIDSLSTGKLLVKTADIRFRVKNVRQTSRDIATLTKNLNGMVVHHNISSTSEKTADIKKSDDSLLRVSVVNSVAEMTVKVPPANVETFMIQVAQMGAYINNSRMDINDKSFDYLSTRLKLKNQQELIDKQKGKTGEESPDNRLAFKNSMVDQQIGNRKTADSARNSIITLSFYESNVVTLEIVANDDLNAYNPPVIKRLAMSLTSGWNMFMELLVWLANLWVIIPFAFGIWLFVRRYRVKVLVKN